MLWIKLYSASVFEYLSQKYVFDSQILETGLMQWTVHPNLNSPSPSNLRRFKSGVSVTALWELVLSMTVYPKQGFKETPHDNIMECEFG